MRKKLPCIELRAVGVVDLDRGLAGKTFLEKCRETRIELDEDHALCHADDVFGECAGARSDLDDRIVFLELELRHDPSRHVWIDKKILPHLLAGQHMEAVECFLDFLAGHVRIS